MASQPKRDASDFKPKGLRGREYASFRAPRYGEVAKAIVAEGSAHYPDTVNATASGETEVIPAPGADKCIRIKYLEANNVGADQRVVSFRAGTGGGDKFKSSMPQYGSMKNANFIDSYWILPPNTALLVNLDDVGDVNVQPGYDIVEAIPTKALTDALTITESLVTVEG